MLRAMEERHNKLILDSYFKKNEHLFSCNPEIYRIITVISPDIRDKIVAMYIQGVEIEEKDDRIDISLTGLIELGFTVKKENGKLSISRQGGQREVNAFDFTREIKSTEAQRKAKGYKSEKAVFVHELGDFIDPYYFVVFMEWLVLQYVFFTGRNEQKSFFKRESIENYLYLWGNSVFVFMNNFCIGEGIGKIGSKSFVPCIAVVAYDKETKIGLLSHITAIDDEAGTIEEFERQFNARGLSLKNAEIYIRRKE